MWCVHSRCKHPRPSLSWPNEEGLYVRWRGSTCLCPRRRQVLEVLAGCSAASVSEVSLAFCCKKRLNQELEKSALSPLTVWIRGMVLAVTKCVAQMTMEKVASNFKCQILESGALQILPQMYIFAQTSNHQT